MAIADLLDKNIHVFYKCYDCFDKSYCQRYAESIFDSGNVKNACNVYERYACFDKIVNIIKPPIITSEAKVIRHR